MEAKAIDYSGAEDCNKNIRASEAMGVCDAKRALLVRILDKISRMANLLGREKEARVAESIDDTIGDCRNYLAIMQHLIEEEREDDKT